MSNASRIKQMPFLHTGLRLSAELYTEQQLINLNNESVIHNLMSQWLSGT